VAVVAAATIAHGASAVRPSQGSLLGGPAGERAAPIPLTRTDVRAQVSAGFSRVVVSQVFVNPHPVPIEAVYVFPLPARAAVSAARVRVGGRTIRGVVAERRVARDTYLAAKSQGQRVITVDEERSNVFTQSVANIPALGEVAVELEYDVPLHRIAGSYEFSFPMVVGPRTVPGQPDGSVPKGGGRLPDTDRVPDASRVTPPLQPPGLRSGRDVSIVLTIDEGRELVSVQSPSHKIRRRRLAGGREEVTMAPRSSIANRDFVVRYRTVREELSVTVHRDPDGSGFIGLTLPPDLGQGVAEAGALPLVIVVDDSDSMAGPTWASARQSVRELVATLPDDASVGIAPLSRRTPLPVRTLDEAHRRRALAYVDGLRPRRGRDPLPTLRWALAQARSGAVVLVSDGWFANEKEMAAMVARFRGARVFPVLLGAAPNAHLGELLASAGSGAPSFIALGEDPGPKVAELAALLRERPLRGLAVEWLGAQVHSVTPQPMPPVYAGRPAHLFARFLRLSGKIVIRIAGAGPAPLRAEVDPRRLASNPALPVLWARQRIAELELDGLRSGVDHAAVIAALGQEFHILTAHTSFVAVDEAAPGAPGTKTVYVPIDVPAGTRRDRILADSEVLEETATVEREKKPRGARGPAATKEDEADRDDAQSPAPPPDAGAMAAAEKDATGADTAVESEPALAPTVERALASEGVLVGTGWLLRVAAAGGVSAAGDRAPLASLELSASLSVTPRLGFGVASRALLPIGAEHPARFALLSRLTVRLATSLGFDLGVGPLVTSDGDLGIAAIATGRWQLVPSLALTIGYEHDIIRSATDADAFVGGFEWTF